MGKLATLCRARNDESDQDRTRTRRDQDGSLQDIDISSQLMVRPVTPHNRRRENGALHALAHAIIQGRQLLFDRLALLPLDLCHAGSGGISIIEEGDGGEQIFRWRAIAGELASFAGGSTPRNWSPCAECLRRGKATLLSRPERYFTYFQDVKPPIVEGLILPMYLEGAAVGTIWIVSH